MTSPQVLTVDQAAALLGVDRHRVVRLIVEGTLKWRMSKDGATVLVEVSSLPLESKPRPAAPQAATQPNTSARPGDHLAISELEAWSKPR